MRAELVAVGSELLLFGRRDANGDWLAGRLARFGVDVGRRTIVGDDEEEIARVLDAARSRSSLVIVTGGLGPTADDLTREGLARSLGRPLRLDLEIRDELVARIAARGYRVLASADSQARVPEGCIALRNPVGSAPGLLCEGPPCWIIALPGVPGEMRAMFEEVLERLGGILGRAAAPAARFLVAGMPESEVDALVRDLIGATPAATVTILAAEEGVEIHVLGTADETHDAQSEVDRITSEVRHRLGTAIAAEGSETLAGAVGALLMARGSRLAVAESCTGGLLGATLTAVPGASAWFSGGFIVYSDTLKRQLLEIPAELLETEGAVSEPVAREMAEGTCRRTGASHALAVTGIAGPDGGTPAKPVGLVFVALAAPGLTVVRRLTLGGSRSLIRRRSVNFALDLLRRNLLEAES